MSERGQIIACLVAVLLLALAGGRAGADVRVALVAGGDDLPSVALAEMMLSEQGEVTLIERSAVRRILAEQALQLSGLRNPAEAIRVGRLAGADLFAVVESAGDPPRASGVVVFDARTGARLYDAPLKARNPEAAAAELSSVVRQAVHDYLAPPAEQVTLGLLSVRNANLPAGLDDRGNAVGRLVLQRLGQHANVRVLERRWLEQVNLERDLPTDGPDGVLLGSMHTLELELSQSPKGNLRVLAWLAAPGNEHRRAVEAEVAAEDFQGLAQALARELAVVLERAEPIAPFDRQAEAMRYASEADFWAAHQRSGRRLEALEAAAALLPEDDTIRMQLIHARLDHASNLMSPGWERVYVSDHQALTQLVRQHDSPTAATFERAGGLALRGLEAVAGMSLNRLPFDARQAIPRVMQRFILWRHDPPAGYPERHYQAYRLLYRQLQDEAFERQLAWVARRSKDFAFIESRERAIVFDTPDAFVADWVERARQSIDARDWPAGDPHAAQQADHLVNDWLLWEHGDPSDRWRMGSEQWRQMRPVMRQLTEQPHPLMTAYGHLGLLLIEGRLGELDADQRQARLHVLALEAATALERAVAAAPPEMRSRHRDQYQQGLYELLPRVARWLELPEAGQQAIARSLLDSSVDQGRLPLSLVHWWLEQTGDGSSDRGFLAQLIAVAQRDGMEVARKLEAVQAGHRREADARAAGSQWQVTQLIDPSRVSDCEYVHHLFVHEDRVYIVGLSGRGPMTVTLLSASLAGGDVQVHNRFTHELPPGRTSMGWGISGPVMPPALFDGSHLYFGTTHHGVLVLPVDEAQPWAISVEQGLPSTRVQAMALMGDRLYLGLGEGGKSAYLVSYDLANQQADLIASTQRQEARSPLDAATPFMITDMLADPARQRMLFIVAELDPRTHKAIGVSGLWAWHHEQDRLEQIMRFHMPEVQFQTEPQHDHVLISSWSTLSRLDLKHDRIETLVGWPPHEQDAQPIHPPWRDAVSGPPPYMLWGDQVWSARARGDMRTGQVESLPEIGGRRPPPSYERDVQLQVVDEKRMLYRRSRGVWLVEPPAMHP